MCLLNVSLPTPLLSFFRVILLHSMDFAFFLQLLCLPVFFCFCCCSSKPLLFAFLSSSSPLLRFGCDVTPFTALLSFCALLFIRFHFSHSPSSQVCALLPLLAKRSRKNPKQRQSTNTATGDRQLTHTHTHTRVTFADYINESRTQTHTEPLANLVSPSVLATADE